MKSRPAEQWRLVAFAHLLVVVVIGLPGAEGRARADSDYRLGPEDTLKISVWKDESLTQEVIVRPDGKISFPLVGDLDAEGRTVEELRTELTKRLASYVQDPVVSVIVTKVSSYMVYVIGRVNHPGEFVLGHQADVMQALSLAGGLTPYASENKILVLRRERGKEVAYPFRYGEVVKGENLGQNMLLTRGDVVVVP